VQQFADNANGNPVATVGAGIAERSWLALCDSQVQNLFKLMGDGARQNRGVVR
jgi:hypothetical protein